jgi:hypothetical protein
VSPRGFLHEHSVLLFFTRTHPGIRGVVPTIGFDADSILPILQTIRIKVDTSPLIWEKTITTTPTPTIVTKLNAILINKQALTIDQQIALSTLLTNYP